MLVYEHLSVDTISTAGAITAVYDLVNGPQYQNARYAPGVAARRASSLAGLTPYAEVEDTLTVDITGSSAAACTAALETLIGLLDQGAQWRDGLNVEAVQIRMRIQFGTAGLLSAIITGPAPGASPASYQAEPDVPTDPRRWIIRDVELRFVRRGRLLATQATASAASQESPTVGTITLGVTLPVVSPLALAYSSVAGTLNPSFLLTAPRANALVSAAALTGTATGYTSVNDAANSPYPSQTNVLRYTPTGTAVAASGAITGAVPTIGRQFAVFAAVRNNSATVTFLIRTRLINQTYGPAGPWQVVDTSSTTPRILPLGIISLSANPGANTLFLEIQALSTSGSPTLDIAYVVTLAVDTPGARMVTLRAASASPFLFYATEANYDRSGGIRAAVSAPGTPGVNLPYDGDIDLAAASDRVLASFVRVNGTAWRPTTQYTLTAYWRRAYLSPQ